MKVKKINKMIYELVMIALVLIMFYPIVMMILVSLKNDVLFASEPLTMRTSFAFENYKKAFTEMGYLSSLKNSAVLSIVSAAICAFFGGCASYAIVKVKTGKKLFMALNVVFLLGLALPQQVAMVPLVLWIQKLGMGNTLVGLIFAFIGANAAFSIFFFTGFVNTVPAALEEAALVDGATRMQTFLKVVLPLLKSPMITLFIITILKVWNNFMYPLILLQGEGSRTLPLAVYMFKGDLAIEWNVLFAATTLAILPLLIMYFIMQKRVISGMTSGAVKG